MQERERPWNASDFLMRIHAPTAKGTIPVKKIRQRSGEEILRLYLPFIAFAVLGALALIFFELEWLRRLGEGFLVAGIVGSLIELFAAGLLIRDVSEELSSLLVGYGLPSQAQELIHDLVHKTKRVYRDYGKTFRIVPHPQKADTHVVLHIVLSYTVVNREGAGALCSQAGGRGHV